MYSSEIRNCRITSSKMGSIYLRCERLQHGVSAVFDETESASVRTMNTKMRVGSGFSIGIAFPTYAEAQKFRTWMRQWAVIAASTGTNPLRVEVPSRKFDRIGIYQSGSVYGDAVGRVTHRMNLTFVGARDPLDVSDAIKSATDVSYFVEANKKQAPDAPFFYPWTSLSSTSDFSADEGLYGTPKAPKAPAPLTITAPSEQGLGF